jgi:hypothetical protein
VKINLHISDLYYRTVIKVESGLYDAVPPISYLSVENRIQTFHPDRMAIAGALIMGNYIASDIELPEPCSPEVAKGLADVFAPLNVYVSNIKYTPFAKPTGERTVLLELPSSERDSQKVQGASEAHLTFGICGDQVFSSSLGVNEIRLACNLRAFATSDPTSLDMGVLGLCFLYAEDFGISRIVLPAGVSRKTRNFGALRRVALSTNIELMTPHD